MLKYRKISCIELIKELPNGDVLVQNEGDSSDQWAIPRETFKNTYILVEE
jgi:hypothetical protein